MSPARARIVEALRKADRHDRLRLYTPVTAGGEDIYVHSKITIVDGDQLRVGSANINNRSMGLDSECDLLVDGRREANRGAPRVIARILCDLVGEHLGVDSAKVERRLKSTDSLIETIDKLRGEGRTLVPLEIETPNPVEKAVADREALDPESAGEYFETNKSRGLLQRLRFWKR